MPPAGEDGESNDSNEQGGNPDQYDRPAGGDRVNEDDDSESPDDEVGSPDGTEENALPGVTGTDAGEPFVMSEIDTEETREVPPGEDEAGEVPDLPGPPGSDGGGDEASGVIGWVLRSEDTGATFLREFVGSVLVVVLIGLLLFAISGVWPPMVAVESGSMEPHMERGDLVFVMHEDRFKPDVAVGDTGIATYRSSLKSGYEKFGNGGDVIIYRQDGSQRSTPIIHRARFWVNESENWYKKANQSFLSGDSCESITNCPAPHSGFITKGDNNEQYDQVSGISGPVKPEWIKGTAELRIPWLGHIRLKLSGLTLFPSSLDHGPAPLAFVPEVEPEASLT
ncbi:MAG: S26 family signal peptidase [Halobacteriales archaeon]